MKICQLLSESRRHKTFFTRGRMACISAIVAMIASQLLMSCSRLAGETNASLAQEFVLKPGQNASITGEPLKMRFLEVVNDSRCPIGVYCIWEGQVTCLVEITYADSQNRMTLTQPGSGQSRADFNEYDIEFEVQPYPEAGKQIAKQDYRLKMVINKKPALSGGNTGDLSGDRRDL